MLNTLSKLACCNFTRQRQQKKAKILPRGGNSLRGLRVGIFMQDFLHNRILALALIATLALSSTGLPVIVMACSMGKTIRATGCASMCCATETGGQSISRIPCAVECRFVERNTTEYLPAKPAVHQTAQKLLLVARESCLHTVTNPSTFVVATSSPPFTRENIPILVSSLLI